MRTVYTAAATEGRDGRVESSGNGTIPERHSAAGYSACFESTPRTSTGGLGRNVGVASANAANANLGKAGSGYALTVALAGRMPSLPPDEDPVQDARHPCSCSNASSGNADVRLVSKVGRPS